MMDATPFIFSPASGSGLTVTAKRYTSQRSAENRYGLTLILAHCIGAHKEHWEPVLQSIFDSQHSVDRHCQIREAWSFDRQNHGDAAIVNKDILENMPKGVSLYDWASAIETFAQSHHVSGHRLVLVGHSAGTAAITLAYRNIPNVAALVLVESVITSRQLFTDHYDVRMATMNFVVSSTLQRRDTWASADQAFEWMSKRVPWLTWDSRAVRIMTTAGMIITEKGEVTLKCDKRQEAASYPEVEAYFDACQRLPTISKRTPIHLIWGEDEGLVLDFIQDALKEVSQATSVKRIPKASHFVVQENPEELAKTLMEVFSSIDVQRSKL